MVQEEGCEVAKLIIDLRVRYDVLFIIEKGDNVGRTLGGKDAGGGGGLKAYCMEEGCLDLCFM